MGYWNAQEIGMLKYSATLSSAKAYADAGNYVDGEFELNDGNHRHKAYENLRIENAWVIIWITEEAERDDFMEKYGEYVKNCKIIRR